MSETRRRKRAASDLVEPGERKLSVKVEKS